MLATFATDYGPSPEDPLALTIATPPNFVYPAKPVISGRYSGCPTISANPDHLTNVIPLADANQTAGLPTLLRVHYLPANVGRLVPVDRSYVVPVESANFSYLPPNTCATTPCFNARLLQVCKTVYPEAVTILYTQNKFVLHDLKDVSKLTACVLGRSFGLLRHLRIEVVGSTRFFYGRRRIGGDNSAWGDLVQQLKCTRAIKLTFLDNVADHSWDI